MGYWRHPKTIQEMKWHEAWKDEEYEIKIRARRRILPTLWDDWVTSSMGDRCWKRFRKTQYRGEQPSARILNKMLLSP